MEDESDIEAQTGLISSCSDIWMRSLFDVGERTDLSHTGRDLLTLHLLITRRPLFLSVSSFLLLFLLLNIGKDCKRRHG